MMKKIGQPTNIALVDWTFSKLCASDDGNNGYFVVTNGIKMRGIFRSPERDYYSIRQVRC